MTFGLVFWIIMLFWLLLSLRSNWPYSPTNLYPVGGSLLLFILLLILGWHEFGPPIHN